ncbi:pilus assembly PilX family protein [Colwellia sp. MEBiC06753]
MRTNSYFYKSKQRGVVLIVSLVFLIALTAVAAGLMLNTTSDMKMSGATEEKVVAEQEAIGAMDETIYRQVNGGTNAFAQALVNFPAPLTDDLVVTSKEGTRVNAHLVNNIYKLEADCPHSKSASSSQVFTCNVLRVQVDRKYGPEKVNNVEVNAGIAQELLR